MNCRMELGEGEKGVEGGTRGGGGAGECECECECVLPHFLRIYKWRETESSSLSCVRFVLFILLFYVLSYPMWECVLPLRFPSLPPYP